MLNGPDSSPAGGNKHLQLWSSGTGRTGQPVWRHTSHDRYTTVNRKQGIGCFAKRVLKVSGSAVPAETRSPLRGCRFQHETAAAQPKTLQHSPPARQRAGIKPFQLVQRRHRSGVELLNIPQRCIVGMTRTQARWRRRREGKTDGRKVGHDVEKVLKFQQLSLKPLSLASK